jgi:protein-disulfide isomerase
MEEILTRKERREQKRLEKKLGIVTSQRNKLYKSIAIWTTLVVVLVGGLYGLSRISSDEITDSFLKDSISPLDWTRGNKDAKITLIEYSDFQCPACATYYPLIKKLEQEFSSQILIAYRHFPLKQHRNSYKAAYASEAAGKQGKFWEMHDMLFEKQAEWEALVDPLEKFRSYAQTIGLDTTSFSTDYSSDEIKKKVDSNFISGSNAFVNSTPTFFLNGKKMVNSGSYDGFKSAVSAAIAEIK